MSKEFLRYLIFITLLAGGFSRQVFAVDHNNIDEGRPLSFDDAEAVAYHERAVETGGSVQSPHEGSAGYGLAAEFLYGVALNTQISIDLDPTWGGRPGSKETRFDFGNASVGGLYNFNREYRNVPAFSIRGDVAFPTGRDASGVDTRLRAIASKTIFQYSRIHLNLDGTLVGKPDDGERNFRSGAVLGFSKPLGYHKHFGTTGVAELGIRSAEQKGDDPILLAGLGLRHQITVRSVIDLGVQSEALSSPSTPHEDVRFIAGYSISF